MAQRDERYGEGRQAGLTAVVGVGAPERAERPADLARLAHELRTPLGAISTLAEVMRDERLGPMADPRYRAYAADIHQSAQQALAVLATYLETGARLAEPAAMSFAELDVAEECRRAVSALTAVAERAGIGIDCDVQSGLPKLIADRRSLRQILDNLLANAIRFTPPGGAVLVGVRHASSGPLEIAVADTGDGITAKELARVLERSTAPDRDGPRRSGSGIGLPLVRALAEANGGKLAITSESGRGTTVTVTFGSDRLVV